MDVRRSTKEQMRACDLYVRTLQTDLQYDSIMHYGSLCSLAIQKNYSVIWMKYLWFVEPGPASYRLDFFRANPSQYSHVAAADGGGAMCTPKQKLMSAVFLFFPDRILSGN